MMRFLICVLACVLAGAPAHADESTKPWAVGVSDAEQAIALELYEQGNAEFQGARFAQALAKYAEAIKHWDHPSIHFNMAVCLINLDQPIDAKKHLDRAMQYGADALGADMYLQGITYQHSLDGQIARVRISCQEVGATITLDGAFMFTGPGEIERLVMPGRHQIVATKRGFLTASETLELYPNKLTKYDVRLVAFKQAVTFERRWAVWKPYAVIGGGVATAGLGLLAYTLASKNFDRYDDAVAAKCPRGCSAAEAADLSGLDAHKTRGELEQRVAFSLFALGGAAVVAGTVGIVLNQPRAVDRAPSIAVGGRGDTLVVTWTGGW